MKLFKVRPDDKHYFWVFIFDKYENLIEYLKRDGNNISEGAFQGMVTITKRKGYNCIGYFLFSNDTYSTDLLIHESVHASIWWLYCLNNSEIVINPEKEINCNEERLAMCIADLSTQLHIKLEG